MTQQDMEFLQYPSIIRDARLSTSSTISNSNRTSCCSFNNEIDGDSVFSLAISVLQEKLYVALDKDFKEGQSVLLWALKNSGGKTICIVHAHQPALMIPFMVGKFPANKLKERIIREYREVEMQKMQNVLNEYLLICKRGGVRAEKLHIETDCIEKGIVKLICQYGMKRLVMGASAAKNFSRKMTALKSKKAIYVNTEAPATCHIWFVCKGHLIYTREGRPGVTNVKDTPEVQQPGPSSGTKRSDPVIPHSVTLGPSTERNHISPSQNHYRAMFVNLHGRTVPELYMDRGRGVSTSNSARHSEASLEEQEGTSMIHLSQASNILTCSSSDVDNSVALTPYVNAEGTWGSHDEIKMHLSLPLPNNDVFNQVSPPIILDESADSQLHNQLKQALAEARNSRRETFEESLRRGKAEQDAFDAILRARESEVVYAEELKQRKELEAALLREILELEKAMTEVANLTREAFEESMRRGKAEEEAVDASRRVEESEKAYAEELKKKREVKAAFLRERLEREKIQNQREKDRDELQHAQDQRSQLESRIAQSVGLFTKYKKVRDELQIERDNALQLADDQKRKQTKSSSTNFSKVFSEFSFLEIEEATRSFHPSLKMGEGDYGTTYKGFLRHTEVIIKMLHTESVQGPPEYQIEVDILSKLRHPNLVTLIGACPDFWTLIFEYLPKGSLEDRLYCKDNSPPLSWQTRIRIAAELCSALVFLHSSTPHSIVHGDVKPANILLDANFVSKLSNFGACRAILPNDMESIGATTCYRSDLPDKAYTEPEFSSSRQPTTKSDVYSFGVVLLRLITGKPDVGIANEVKNALDKGELKSILDYSAGDWPYVQAHQLAHLGLRCVEISKKRPDLGSKVWKVLQAMQASCRVSSSSVRFDSQDPCQAPHYFICPIFQEVMRDPLVAADGFTYEAEALKGWLDSGHDTSPMTNLKLANTKLVPNLALRSTIQEWHQKCHDPAKEEENATVKKSEKRRIRKFRRSSAVV